MRVTIFFLCRRVADPILSWSWAREENGRCKPREGRTLSVLRQRGCEVLFWHIDLSGDGMWLGGTSSSAISWGDLGVFALAWQHPIENNFRVIWDVLGNSRGIILEVSADNLFFCKQYGRSKSIDSDHRLVFRSSSRWIRSVRSRSHVHSRGRRGQWSLNLEPCRKPAPSVRSLSHQKRALYTRWPEPRLRSSHVRPMFQSRLDLQLHSRQAYRSTPRIQKHPEVNCRWTHGGKICKVTALHLFHSPRHREHHRSPLPGHVPPVGGSARCQNFVTGYDWSQKLPWW